MEHSSLPQGDESGWDGADKSDGVETAPLIEFNKLRIGLDVPLELRIDNINPIDRGTDWQTSGVITEQLGTTERQVFRMINELGIESETKIIDGIEMSAYPPYTFAVLHDEITWHESYRALPIHLRVAEMSELLGRSIKATNRLLATFSIEPKPATPKEPLPFKVYPKYAYRLLKQHEMLVPPAYDWLTIEELSVRSGLERRHIVRVLEEHSIMPKIKRSALNGHAITHYPPVAVTVLANEARSMLKPGGSWFTVKAMQVSLGRSNSWTVARASKYAEMSEPRLADTHRAESHYPPFVLQQLKAKSELERRANRIPEAENWSGSEIEQLSLGVESLKRHITAQRLLLKIQQEQTETLQPEQVALAHEEIKRLQRALRRVRHRQSRIQALEGSGTS